MVFPITFSSQPNMTTCLAIALFIQLKRKAIAFDNSDELKLQKTQN